MDDATFLPPGPVEAGILAELPRSFHVRHEEIAGVRLRVLEGGEGPPLVLLHGRGNAATMWFPLLPDLARSHRVIAIDLPGFAGSRPIASGHLPKRLSFESALAFFVDPVEAWLERSGLAEAALAGHSLGGLVSLELALRKRVQPSKLALIDAMGLGPEMTLAGRAFFAAGPERLAKWLGPTLFGKIATFPETTTGKKLAALSYELYTNAGAPREGARAFDALFTRTGPTPNRAERLREIAQPVLVLWGSKDEVFPVSIARDAERALKRPELAVLPAGHSPHLESAEAAPLLARFLG